MKEIISLKCSPLHDHLTLLSELYQFYFPVQSSGLGIHSKSSSFRFSSSETLSSCRLVGQDVLDTIVITDEAGCKVTTVPPVADNTLWEHPNLGHALGNTNISATFTLLLSFVSPVKMSTFSHINFNFLKFSNLNIFLHFALVKIFKKVLMLLNRKLGWEDAIQYRTGDCLF